MKNKTKVLEIFSEGIYREEKGKKIFGKSRLVFIHNLEYHLTEIKIYKDGKIDCWGLVDFEEFKEKIKNGWVKTSIPEDSIVSVFSLGHFNIKNTQFIKESELIREVEDTIHELNGLPTTLEICRDIFEKYNDNPTKENREKLKKAYENIPEHNRLYVLGDMDKQDYPIRKIIY